MKINFTKKEYRALVDLLGMADWVVGAHSTTEDGEAKKYEELIQHVFSHSKEMDCSDLIEHNKGVNAYCFTQEAEETSESRRYIEKFETDSFWESLTSNLASRDLESLTDFDEMTGDECFSELCKHEAKWANEFESHGLNRVKVETN